MLTDAAIAKYLSGVSFEKKMTPSDSHVDRPLTNISVAYMQNQANFVADRIFSRIPVQHQSDLYWKMDRSYWNRSEMRARPASTETPGMGLKWSTEPYFCNVFGLHMDVDDREQANADSPLAPFRTAAEAVAFQGLLFREIRWVADYFQPAIWSTNYDGSGSDFVQWNTASTSDPVANVSAWKSAAFLKSGGLEMNTMVMSRKVWDALKLNDTIIDRVNYGQTPGGPAMVTRETIAALFEVDNIYVLNAVQNTAKEGAAEVNAFIAADSVALFHVPPAPGMKVASPGYTFVWNGYIGANQGQRITNFRMDPIRSDRVEIEMAFDHKVVSPDLGVFAQKAIS